jgi:hypothetical protein
MKLYEGYKEFYHTKGNLTKNTILKVQNANELLAQTGSSQVGFVVDKVSLGQVFSEYFGFFCQSSFHQFLHNHHQLSSGAGTISQ